MLNESLVSHGVSRDITPLLRPKLRESMDVCETASANVAMVAWYATDFSGLTQRMRSMTPALGMSPFATQ